MGVADIIAGWRVVVAPGYEAWRTARHGLLTASDVAGVLGLDPHKSRNRVLAGKRGAAPPDVVVTAPMRGGTFLEDPVFRWYLDDVARHNRELGLPPPEGSTCRNAEGTSLLVAHADPTLRLAASPDGLVLDCEVPHLVEVKVTNPDRWRDSWGTAATKVPRAWARYSSVEPPSFGKCPLKHWVQLQTQMLVTGVGAGVIVGDCGTARLDIPFPFDAAFAQHIEDATRAFWRDVPLTPGTGVAMFEETEGRV